MPTEPETCLLKAFQILHKRGYEGLRVYAAVYGTGHWRCSLGVIGQPFEATKEIEFFYTSASAWRVFHPDEQEYHDPEQIADLLVERYSKLLEMARFVCKPYVVWYDLLLEACGPNGIFFMYDGEGHDA